MAIAALILSLPRQGKRFVVQENDFLQEANDDLVTVEAAKIPGIELVERDEINRPCIIVD